MAAPIYDVQLGTSSETKTMIVYVHEEAASNTVPTQAENRGGMLANKESPDEEEDDEEREVADAARDAASFRTATRGFRCP